MKKELHKKIVDKIFSNLKEYHGFAWFDKTPKEIQNEILDEQYKSTKMLLIRNKP